jgi:signal transduction histidine kinase
MSAPSPPINAPQRTRDVARPPSFSRVWERLAHIQPGWLADVPDEERRARLARVALAVLQVPLLAHFIGWITLPWLGLVLANEFALNPAAARRWLTPHAQTDPARADRNWTVLIVWGSALYGWGWVYAWMTNGAPVAFLAPFWLGTACIHGLTYFSNKPAQFSACVGIAALTCVGVPLFVAHAGLPYWCVLLGVGQFLFTVFLSYRDRHYLIRMLIRSRAESRAATQSNIAKSQFLATMSHELRTPLNAVIGYAELLQEDLNTRGLDQGADDAARISRAARHLLEMINEILDLSKIESGKLILAPSEVDIAAVLQDVIETASYLARDNGNALTLEAAPEVGRIQIDGSRLRQCALNLVSNACKFTENGRVCVRAAIEGDAILRIDVEDTGCGIPAEKAAHLFEAFVQIDSSTTRKHMGTGLGLVITRRLAQMMGGDVSFVSAEGAGSTFTLRTPAARDDVLVLRDVA